MPRVMAYRGRSPWKVPTSRPSNALFGQANAIAPGIFCLVNGAVSGFEHRVDGGISRAPSGNSDADRDARVETGLVGDHVICDGFIEPLARTARGSDFGGIRADNQEFFATDAADNIFGAYRFLQYCSDAAQHPIASGMTVGVIDMFKIIDIDHHAGQRPIISHRTCPFLLKALHGVTPIG